MATFSEWVDALARARGYKTDLATAQAIGVSHTALPRWRRPGAGPPDVQTLRKVSEAFHVPMLEALIAAGYVSSAEVGVRSTEARLELATNDELLAEVARRMGGDPGDGVVVAMRSTGSFDPDEPTWNPPGQ